MMSTFFSINHCNLSRSIGQVQCQWRYFSVLLLRNRTVAVSLQLKSKERTANPKALALGLASAGHSHRKPSHPLGTRGNHSRSSPLLLQLSSNKTSLFYFEEKLNSYPNRTHVRWNSNKPTNSSGNGRNKRGSPHKINVTGRGKKKKNLSSIVQPVQVKLFENPDDINVGAELSDNLKKEDLIRLLNQFYRRSEVKDLAEENGLDNRLFHQAYVSFRKFCVDSEALPTELHILISDILQEAGHVTDLFPYFLEHAKEIFPHLDCMDDLRKISDLRLPANWYPEARGKERKVIYHAGPTNSGKTYHALERFMQAKSGVYCGPLRMLATEVFYKTNAGEVECDLVTGEERRYVREDGTASSHVACTVEMASVTQEYEVAVIDEIQMIRDKQRGWAWTRALLGICAKEIHICGEGSAINLVKELLYATGDEVTVTRYKRLTTLSVLNKPIENFDNVRPGDCIVCFSKNDIYHVSRQLEQRRKECSVIYGTLPPGTKIAQSRKFNDPENTCNIMVATDAIGMGLNLNIKRIIFYSIMKPNMNEQGELEVDMIPVSTALQIAGRAGRYGTHYADGEVTSFRGRDLPALKELLTSRVDEIEQAGLHPTAEQIELFAYHLPKATLSNLIDIFVTLSQMDNDLYFMCNQDDFKYLADMIEHVPLPLRTRYVFCCAPISKKHPFTCSMFLKFARKFSSGEPLTHQWLARQLSWPLQTPKSIDQLVHLEGVFDVLDLYLWLSYRFQDMFPNPDDVREMQKELDGLIQLGVFNITKLIKSQEAQTSRSGTPALEDIVEPEEQDIKPMLNTLNHDHNDTRVVDNAKKMSFKTMFLNAKRKMKANTAYDSRLAASLEEPTKTNYGQVVPKKKSVTGANEGPESSYKAEHVKYSQRKPLTKQLLEQGILTEEMLKKIQKELSETDE